MIIQHIRFIQTIADIHAHITDDRNSYRLIDKRTGGIYRQRAGSPISPSGRAGLEYDYVTVAPTYIDVSRSTNIGICYAERY